MFAEHISEGNAYSPGRFLTLHTAMEAYCRVRFGKKDFRLMRDYANVSSDVHGCTNKAIALIGATRDYVAHLTKQRYSTETIEDTMFDRHTSRERADASVPATRDRVRAAADRAASAQVPRAVAAPAVRAARLATSSFRYMFAAVVELVRGAILAGRRQGAIPSGPPASVLAAAVGAAVESAVVALRGRPGADRPGPPARLVAGEVRFFRADRSGQAAVDLAEPGLRRRTTDPNLNLNERGDNRGFEARRSRHCYLGIEIRF